MSSIVQPLQTTSPEQIEAVIQRLRAQLRSGQQAMADWHGGPLAVSAVPGAGKSTGMAAAAAIFLARRYLGDRTSLPVWLADGRRQLVLVTFTRSAAANLRTRIHGHLQAAGLPRTGFVVQTLHGLALHIALRHSDRSGLNLDRLTLTSPSQSYRLIRACVEQWIQSHPALYQQLIEGTQFDGEEAERLRRQSVLRTEVLPDLADTLIREAKSSGLSPEQLRHLEAQMTPREGVEYPVLEITAGLLESYQALMTQRRLIDYDDMILAGLRVLRDESIRISWQSQVAAVFEDEAQDSTPLQTELLQTLATEPDRPHLLHWIRVGDPNQAINSTFTPADPIFFREFCAQCETQQRLVTMDQAGRSTAMIMHAANFVLQWVNRRYSPANPTRQSSLTPFRLQTIYPVAANDPQIDANPAPIGSGIEIATPADAEATVQAIGDRVLTLLADDPDLHTAVLVRENKQGQFVASRLQFLEQHGITIYEVGQQERYSRVPTDLLALLQFVDRPHSPDYLKNALKVLSERQIIPSQDLNAIVALPEQFLYPSPLASPLSAAAQQARHCCHSLLRARLELPLYQLIPFLALVLNYDQTELATADKLAERLLRQISDRPSLTAVLAVLTEIISNGRTEVVETDDETHYHRSRQLTIITMHKAKGLDWDVVFLPFLYHSTIPGSLRVPPQAQFLGDFTLAEVARAKVRVAQHSRCDSLPSLPLNQAWNQAGQLKTAEEFRLLYVAMTRARRLLWLSASSQGPFSWSKPENQEEKEPCPVLPALRQELQRRVF